MTRSAQISIGILILGLWSLVAAGTVKDFYFEMKAKKQGEIINYSTLSEFCGITGDKRPGESDFDYGLRRVRGMTTAILAMSLMSLVFLVVIGGGILGLFYLGGAFRDET